MKEDRDTTMAKLKKEIVKVKVREVYAKKSSTEEYTSPDDF